MTTFEQHKNIKCLAFSKDNTLALGGAEGLRLIDPADGKLRKQITPEHCQDVAFSPDGKLLAAHLYKKVATNGFDSFPYRSVIAIWDLESGKIQATLPYLAGRGQVRMAFSPDNRFLATGWRYAGESPELIVWDLPRLKVENPMTAAGAD